jgi:hypothetical protein
MIYKPTMSKEQPTKTPAEIREETEEGVNEMLEEEEREPGSIERQLREAQREWKKAHPEDDKDNKENKEAA